MIYLPSAVERGKDAIATNKRRVYDSLADMANTEFI